MTENSSTPEPAPTASPAASGDPIASHSHENPLAAQKRSRTRTALIAGGAVLAAAVLAGGGIAIGAAVADEADDDDDRSPSGTSADIGSDSAAELSEIIAAASESAEGDAVSIEARRDGGWDVQFETSTGDESEVRVAADGTTRVVSTDAADTDDSGDSAPLGVLDADTVDALVAAALDEVDGRIMELEIDDDAASPFDVSVVQANGRELSLGLDADLTVLSIDSI